MKNRCTFAATVINNGGLLCLFVAGIFYALPSHSDTATLRIQGSDTPARSVNAPAAVVVVTVSGKGRNRFLYSADNKLRTGMTAYNNERLNGDSVPPSNRQAHDTGDNLTYYFDDAHPVRVTLIDGQPWFACIDVCRSLGLVNNRDAISLLDDDEHRVSVIPTPGPVARQRLICVSESGLYALIFKSRKPGAKKFRKWVTSDVLPSIRKNGEYRMRTAEERRVAVKVARSTMVKDLQGALDYSRTNYRLLSEAYMRLSDENKKLREFKKNAEAAGPVVDPAIDQRAYYDLVADNVGLRGESLELTQERDDLRRRFETECDAKNRAYYFILAAGHFDEYATFCKTESDPAAAAAKRLIAETKKRL